MLLRQIEYFQKVVKLNSFTEAAAECSISQSAISQQIKALESDLGVQLLIRRNRGFEVTKAGELFYRKSLVLTAELEQLCRETVRAAKEQKAELRIGYLSCYAGEEFQQTIADFTAKYPDVDVHVMSGTHEELYRALKSDQADVVLNDLRRTPSDEYVNLELTSGECVVEVSAHSPLAGLTEIDIEDLTDVPCILVAPRTEHDTERNYYRDIIGFKGDFIFADNLELARMQVISGNGVMPVEGITMASETGMSIHRIRVLKRHKTIERRYYAFWKQDNSGYYVEEFGELLKNRFRV